MNDGDYAIVKDGNAIGWVRGLMVAKRVLEKTSSDLQARDITLFLRVENGGCTHRLVHAGAMYFMPPTSIHVVAAVPLSQIPDPAAVVEDEDPDLPVMPHTRARVSRF